MPDQDDKGAGATSGGAGGNGANSTLDVIVAAGGAGGGGGMTVAGGAGNDSLLGGEGNDTLDVGGGNDSVLGGQGGDDLIVEGGEGEAVTLVVPPDHEPDLPRREARKPTDAEAEAIKEHVELRVSEIVAFCRSEADKFGQPPESLAQYIASRLQDAFDHHED